MSVAIVSGVGPLEGLGAQLCVRFAGLGMHVLIAGRTQGKLDAVVEAIVSAGGSAEAVIADATSETDTERLFNMAGDDLSLAIYNTGNNTPGRIADMSASTLKTVGASAVLEVFYLAGPQFNVSAAPGAP